MIGFSSVTAGIARSMSLARIIKQKYPDAKIIMGGIHPTVMPEEPLLQSQQDVVVIGEGEYTLLSLIRYFRDGGDLHQIKGIAYVENGQVFTDSQSRFT